MAKTVQVGFRLPVDLVKRIDGYAARLTAENPGLEITRALAVKALLTRALDALDAQTPAAPATKTPAAPATKPRGK